MSGLGRTLISGEQDASQLPNLARRDRRLGTLMVHSDGRQGVLAQRLRAPRNDKRIALPMVGVRRRRPCVGVTRRRGIHVGLGVR